MSIFLPQAGYNISLLQSLESQLGVKFKAAKWYLDWSTNFTPEVANAFHNHGAIPELTWEPSVGGTGFPYTDVTAGNYDTYINSFATSVRDLGYPIRIVLAPEMNTDWTPWGIGLHGNTDETHKAFWRYVVDKFRATGATNAQWVWSPNIHPYGEVYTYAQMYPGDAYVDFVGLEGYNWGTSQSWSVWQSFRQVFESSYNSLVALTNKKILLTEIASTESGGDKAAWIEQMGNDLRTGFPRIQGFTWFNINKETDWRITSSEAARAAFAAMVNGTSSSSSSSSSGSSAANQSTQKKPVQAPPARPAPVVAVVEPSVAPVAPEPLTLPVPVEPKITDTLYAASSNGVYMSTLSLAHFAIWFCALSIVLAALIMTRRKIRRHIRLARVVRSRKKHIDSIHNLHHRVRHARERLSALNSAT